MHSFNPASSTTDPQAGLCAGLVDPVEGLRPLTSRIGAWRCDSVGDRRAAPGWERREDVHIFSSPDAVMEFWYGLTDTAKAAEVARTARAMRRLLMRPARLEFPRVPVLLDGQQMKDAMLDDAFLYLRVERMSRQRAGAMEGFDPFAFLAHALTNVIAQIWKADPMRASRWPVSERRWQQNLDSDESEDIRLLGICARTLAGPLLLTSDMA